MAQGKTGGSLGKTVYKCCASFKIHAKKPERSRQQQDLAGTFSQRTDERGNIENGLLESSKSQADTKEKRAGDKTRPGTRVSWQSKGGGVRKGRSPHVRRRLHLQSQKILKEGGIAGEEPGTASRFHRKGRKKEKERPWCAKKTRLRYCRPERAR